MDIQKKGIISLVKAAIIGESVSLPVDFDLELALDTVSKHQITSMIYYGASNCGIDPNLPVMKNLFGALCKCIAVSEKQKYEVSNVCRAFSENGVDHMPLKGVNLREMYPYADMRLMGDADILIKVEQYDRIRSIMLALGFTPTTESDHEHVWKKSGIVIELHKRLIPSYNKDYYAYYGNGWKLAVPSEAAPHRYTMSAEDQMIYLFTHFAKHYRSGGIGIRHITDLYVYRRSVGELDGEYINRELKKLKIHEFYNNVMKTIDVWFNGLPSDEKTAHITDAIFESGVYGLTSQRTIGQTVICKKQNSVIKNEKLQYVMRMIFPSLANMKLKYGFLEKLPVLLPFVWVMRLFKIAFFKGEKAKRFYSGMKNISSQDISDYQQALRYVGLNFDFEE